MAVKPPGTSGPSDSVPPCGSPPSTGDRLRSPATLSGLEGGVDDPLLDSVEVHRRAVGVLCRALDDDVAGGYGGHAAHNKRPPGFPGGRLYLPCPRRNPDPEDWSCLPATSPSRGR